LLDGYRRELARRCETEAEPPASPLGGIPEWFRQHADAALMRRWREQAFRHVTEPLSTHPALKDRLFALGEPAMDDVDLSTGADRDLLGAARDELVKGMDDLWRQGHRGPWNRM